jgi:hypothetical protein
MDGVLREYSYPLHQNQYASHTEKLTKTAFHSVTHIESATERKEIALAVFLDRTSFDVI